MLKTYVEKQVPVTAVQWRRLQPSNNNFDEIVRLNSGSSLGLLVDDKGCLLINTPESVLRANNGDYVIRDASGNLKVLPEEDFKLKYIERLYVRSGNVDN